MPVESTPHRNEAAAAIRQTGSGPPRLSRNLHVFDASNQFAGGGFSPDCSIVVSVFLVVSPSGVETVVSVVLEDSFEQPLKPRVPRLARTTSDRSRFINQPFNWECFAGTTPRELYHSPDALLRNLHSNCRRIKRRWSTKLAWAR